MIKGTGIDIGPLAGTPEEVMARAESLVATFSTLLGKDFDVRQGEGGCTDCETFIQIDPHDPEAYLVAEHELSHPMFGSDPGMGDIFIGKRAERLLQSAGIAPASEQGKAAKPELKALIHTTWNILEDWRCVSLWSELYPGGGELLQDRWRILADREHAEPAKTDLMSYLIRKASGIETPEAPENFRNCGPHLDKAMSQVRGTDAVSCLAILGRLIDDIGNELLGDPPSPTPPPSPSSGGDPQNQQGPGTPQKSKGQGPPPPGSKKEKEKSDGSSGDEDEDDEEDEGDEDSQEQKKPEKERPKSRRKAGTSAKARKRKRAKEKLEKLTASTTNSTPSTGIGQDDTTQSLDFRIRRGGRPDAAVLARVRKVEAAMTPQADGEESETFKNLLKAGAEAMAARLADARAAMGHAQKSASETRDEKFMANFQVAGIKAHRVRATAPLPAPTRTAVLMKKELDKLRMKRRYRYSDEGDDVDMDVYLEAMLSGELDDAEVFVEVKRESGMELLLLGDVSYSMVVDGLNQLDHATADIKFAAGTNIVVHQWGFSNDVFVFQKPGGSFRGAQGLVYGGTNLVQAVDSAVEWASHSKTERAIILMTDGYPTSCRGRRSTGNPQTDMHNVLKEAKNDGIILSVLAIGPAHTKEMYDDSFGKGNYGHITDKASLGVALRNAARALLTAHIKRRTR